MDQVRSDAPALAPAIDVPPHLAEPHNAVALANYVDAVNAGDHARAKRIAAAALTRGSVSPDTVATITREATGANRGGERPAAAPVGQTARADEKALKQKLADDAMDAWWSNRE